MSNLESKNSSDAIFAQLCAYEVKWPLEAVVGDELVLIADHLAESAQVYVTSVDGELTSSEATGFETKINDQGM